MTLGAYVISRSKGRYILNKRGKVTKKEVTNISNNTIKDRKVTYSLTHPQKRVWDTSQIF